VVYPISAETVSQPYEFCIEACPHVLWFEVNPAMLSASTIRAAHQYVNFVEIYDSGAYSEQGLTPLEMEAKRRRLHNQLIALLRADHVELGINERSNSQQVAEKIRRWLEEE